jgi:hypothetical protein
MAENKDFLDAEDGDIGCLNGDFDIGVSDDQHVMDLFEAMPGHYKQSPMTGIGIIRALNGSMTGQMKRIARINLAADGYTLNSISADDDENLEIDYEK